MRAVEALVVPEQGKTKSQFKSRVEALADVSHTTLADIYDLRSATEHMNDLKAAAPHLFEPTEALALRRVHQAHELARWLYRRILSQPETLPALFASDESIRAFQGLPPGRKKEVLGERLDIEALDLDPRFVASLRTRQPPTR